MMMKFKKLVAIEPVSLVPDAEAKLGDYAEEIVLFRDIPADDEEILRRIGAYRRRRMANIPPTSFE